MTPEPYRVVIEKRISDLLGYRRWYRAHVGWMPEQQTDDRAELRYLLRLTRPARRAARWHEADPLTIAKGYEDWTAGEYTAGWGK